MDSIGRRITISREALKLNQAELGKRCQVSRAAVSQWENGSSIPTGPNLVIVAKALKINPEWLATGKGPREARGRKMSQLVGYVGGGAKIYPIDDHALGAGFEEVPAPPGYEDDCVAVKVRGDSLYPQVEDGWLIYYAKRVEGVPEEALGKLCVVHLTSGETMVKKLFRGEKKGLFRLDSINAPSINGALVDWASQVIAIIPA